VPVKLAVRSIKRDPATKVVTGVQVRPHVQHKVVRSSERIGSPLNVLYLPSDWSNVNTTPATPPQLAWHAHMTHDA
jgi:hypothetical protein